MRSRPITHRTDEPQRRERRRVVVSPLPLVLAGALIYTAAITAPAAATAHVTWTSPWQSARYVGQTQEHAQWCADASASISLGSIGVHVGQTRLARQTGTTLADGMTDAARYVRTLNADAAPAGITYSLTSEATPNALGTLLASEMRTGAVIQPVVADELPYAASNAGHEGHVIVVVAVNPTDHEVRVWDPWASRQHVHTVTYAQLYHASQGPGDTYVLTRTEASR